MPGSCANLAQITLPGAFVCEKRVENATGMSVAEYPIESVSNINDAIAQKEEALMLWTIFVILLILWLVGMVSSYTLGGFIHILLVIALVVLLLNIIGGRRTTI
jgi:beta-lactamase regulating signal transducer with metallopeptidase domain